MLRETRLHRNKTTCACTSSTTQILHLFSVHSWTTPGNGWLTWFSQSLVLTQPSVCVVILIASAQRGETLCPAPLHYAALHCVPLPHGSRLMCYQNDDACQKYWPKLHNKLLQQRVCVCVCVCVRARRCSLFRSIRNADRNHRAGTRCQICGFIDAKKKNEQERQGSEGNYFKKTTLYLSMSLGIKCHFVSFIWCHFSSQRMLCGADDFKLSGGVDGLERLWLHMIGGTILHMVVGLACSLWLANRTALWDYTGHHLFSHRQFWLLLPCFCYDWLVLLYVSMKGSIFTWVQLNGSV